MCRNVWAGKRLAVPLWEMSDAGLYADASGLRAGTRMPYDSITFFSQRSVSPSIAITSKRHAGSVRKRCR